MGSSAPTNHKPGFVAMLLAQVASGQQNKHIRKEEREAAENDILLVITLKVSTQMISRKTKYRNSRYGNVHLKHNKVKKLKLY